MEVGGTKGKALTNAIKQVHADFLVAHGKFQEVSESYAHRSDEVKAYTHHDVWHHTLRHNAYNGRHACTGLGRCSLPRLPGYFMAYCGPPFLLHPRWVMM